MKTVIHPHPGKVLRQRLIETRILIFDLADRTNIPEDAIRKLINGEIALTPKMAEKFARFFGDKFESWIKAQINFELSHVIYESSYPNQCKKDPMSGPLPDKFG